MIPTHTSPDRATAHSLMPIGDTMLDSPARLSLREAAAALDLAEQFGAPVEMCLALAQVARCYRALHAPQPAEWYLQQARRWAGVLGAADQSIELLCLLAEVCCEVAETHVDDDRPRCRAALERARDHAFEISEMAAHTSDPQWEIKVLLRAGDVLDRCGDHDDAVQLQSRAVRLIYEHSLTHGARPAI